MLFIKGIQEIIILFIIIIINIPIIYFTVMSLFYKAFSGGDTETARTKEEIRERDKGTDKVKIQKPDDVSNSEEIKMTPLNFIKATILIAFIIGLFAAEIILIDKIGQAFFDYPFIQKVIHLGS